VRLVALTPLSAWRLLPAALVAMGVAVLGTAVQVRRA
jgi:hypothetical protein